jgi:hypothetical protein
MSYYTIFLWILTFLLLYCEHVFFLAGYVPQNGLEVVLEVGLEPSCHGGSSGLAGEIPHRLRHHLLHCTVTFPVLALRMAKHDGADQPQGTGRWYQECRAKPVAGGQLVCLLNQCQEDFEHGWAAKDTAASVATVMTGVFQKNGIIDRSMVWNYSPILSGQNVIVWFLMCSISTNILTVLAILLTP